MPGPLPDVLRPVTVPASWLYGRVIARRNRRFDGGVGVHRLGVPVISVGNITTGGVGKTPMVAWMADRLAEAGHRPLIAMRGYGARPGSMSDEQMEYAVRLPEVPVVASPRRAEAVRAYLAGHPEIDGVLLDDGFQHRMLRRDLDIVLLDARAATLDDRLLPAGHLRESPDGLRRADAIVVTHAEQPDVRLADALARHAGRAPVAWASHVWTALTIHEGGVARRDEVSWLAGRRVLTMLGVARPAGVRRQVEEAGSTIVDDVPVRDHEPYDDARLAAVRPRCAGLDALVCTGKDWAKLRDLVGSSWPCPIVVPELRLAFVEGEGDLAALVLDAFRAGAG